jgi:hypothetical protein
MMISNISSLLVLMLSTVVTMSTSETHRLRQAQDRNGSAQRVLHFREVKNHVLFKQAMGGQVGSTGGITRSARAETLHQQQRTLEALQANIMAYPRRELQTAQSMTFEQFCSTVTVCICSAGVTP